MEYSEPLATSKFYGFGLALPDFESDFFADLFSDLLSVTAADFVSDLELAGPLLALPSVFGAGLARESVL